MQIAFGGRKAKKMELSKIWNQPASEKVRGVGLRKEGTGPRGALLVAIKKMAFPSKYARKSGIFR